MKTIPVIRRADEGDVSPSPVSSPPREREKRNPSTLWGEGKRVRG